MSTQALHCQEFGCPALMEKIKEYEEVQPEALHFIEIKMLQKQFKSIATQLRLSSQALCRAGVLRKIEAHLSELGVLRRGVELLSPVKGDIVGFVSRFGRHQQRTEVQFG